MTNVEYCIWGYEKVYRKIAVANLTNISKHRDKYLVAEYTTISARLVIGGLTRLGYEKYYQQ